MVSYQIKGEETLQCGIGYVTKKYHIVKEEVNALLELGKIRRIDVISILQFLIGFRLGYFEF